MGYVSLREGSLWVVEWWKHVNEVVHKLSIMICFVDIRLMAEIRNNHHLGCKKPINNGRSYL